VTPALPANPLCVALDARDAELCLGLARATAEHAGAFKIGLTAFGFGGPPLVRDVAGLRPVFVDLKLHDIPAQVAGAVAAVNALGASYTTVHAAGGEEMIRAAVDTAGDGLAVLAVTVLTSLDHSALGATGVGRAPADQVLLLADLALRAGAGGLVCSPLELARLRAAFGPSESGGPLLVAPGIRSGEGPRDDQRRSLSARRAVELGADLVVVGRPVARAADPAEAARRLGLEVLV
jgi:orotidine-5'-phosphate decarboxylase